AILLSLRKCAFVRASSPARDGGSSRSLRWDLGSCKMDCATSRRKYGPSRSATLRASRKRPFWRIGPLRIAARRSVRLRVLADSLTARELDLKQALMRFAFRPILYLRGLSRKAPR